MVPPRAFARLVLPRGVTTVVADLTIANVQASKASASCQSAEES
jgi:adenine deaminase